MRFKAKEDPYQHKCSGEELSLLLNTNSFWPNILKNQTIIQLSDLGTHIPYPYDHHIL